MPPISPAPNAEGPTLKSRSGGAPVGLACVWLACVGVGFYLTLDYAYAAGPVGPSDPSWPAASELRPDREGCTLLIFLHPDCPCSRATLAAVAALRSRDADRGLAAVAVLCLPDGFSGAGAQGAIARAVAAQAGLGVFRDAGAVETRRFGARTSGEALLFDRFGQLRFRGGLTPARGHEGACLGLDAVRAVLRGEAPERAAAPVFGCALLNAPAPGDTR